LRQIVAARISRLNTRYLRSEPGLARFRSAIDGTLFIPAQFTLYGWQGCQNSGE